MFCFARGYIGGPKKYVNMYGGEGGARGIMLVHELNKIFNQNQNKTDQ